LLDGYNQQIQVIEGGKTQIQALPLS